MTRLTFSDFTLDLDERRLLRGQIEVHLAPKAFELLALLIRNRPRAIAKDEILQSLWPDTFVTENSLATLIADLRAALGDNPRTPSFVRTVHTFGYAFVAAVQETGGDTAGASTARSRWRLIWDDHDIALDQGTHVLGRSGTDVIVVDSPTVSRHHARLSIEGDRATIEDIGSKNGTRVGGVAVTAATPLQDGDQIQLGAVSIVVQFDPDAGTTETVASAALE